MPFGVGCDGMPFVVMVLSPGTTDPEYRCGLLTGCGLRAGVGAEAKAACPIPDPGIPVVNRINASYGKTESYGIFREE